MRAALAVAAVGLASATAVHAEPWYRGPHGHNRVVHVTITTTAGLLYLSSETFLKSSLAAEACRWCAPPSFDRSVRDSLVWTDRGKANTYSNLTGYVAAPVFGVGLTALGSLSGDQAGWGQLIDDTMPIFETVALSQVFTQIVKFSAGRERPFVHFAVMPQAHDKDDNLSFFSGHSALAFGIATSAGMVAHWKHAKTEPVIWAVGMTVATSTAYLRIAADKHYLSDVLVGGAVGVASGLTVPLLMRRDASVSVVPAPNGVALAGAF
jgi:membrane-associated phospholipid phosphatase